MAEDSNFIMHQVKSTNNDFDFVVGKDTSQSEIIIKQQQDQKGKVYADIDNMLLHGKYEEAVQNVYAQKFELDRGSYYALGQWLIRKLQSIPEVNSTLLSELVVNMKKYS